METKSIKLWLLEMSFYRSCNVVSKYKAETASCNCAIPVIGYLGELLIVLVLVVMSIIKNLYGSFRKRYHSKHPIMKDTSMPIVYTL